MQANIHYFITMNSGLREAILNIQALQSGFI